MASKKDFKLVPKPVPPRRRSSFYKQIVDEFIEGGESSALIEGTDRKPVTLVQGIRKVLDAEEIDTVRVVQRGEEVYLVRNT